MRFILIVCTILKQPLNVLQSLTYVTTELATLFLLRRTRVCLTLPGWRENESFFPLFSRSKHNFRWQWLGVCLSSPWHPLFNGSTEACELNSSADIFHASIDVWKKVNCDKSCLVFFSDLMMLKALPTDCLEQIHYHSICKMHWLALSCRHKIFKVYWALSERSVRVCADEL